MLARGHQNLVWERTRQTNRLRSTLREFYPQALEAFTPSELAARDGLAVLAKAPTPTRGKALTISQIKAVLTRAGRQRNLETTAAHIKTSLHSVGLARSEVLSNAMGIVVQSLVAVIAELNTQIGLLETEMASHFVEHPDAHIYLSMPGIGYLIGPRMLGEFGDDPNRFADAKSRRNYAATSPITTASGKSKFVNARYIGNKRLSDAAMRWAFCSITADDDCRALYDQQRAKHGSHNKALRALANRLVGILHGCLTHQNEYDPDIAWAHRRTQQNQKAA